MAVILMQSRPAHTLTLGAEGVGVGSRGQVSQANT